MIAETGQGGSLAAHGAGGGLARRAGGTWGSPAVAADVHERDTSSVGGGCRLCPQTLVRRDERHAEAVAAPFPLLSCRPPLSGFDRR